MPVFIRQDLFISHTQGDEVLGAGSWEIILANSTSPPPLSRQKTLLANRSNTLHSDYTHSSSRNHHDTQSSSLFRIYQERPSTCWCACVRLPLTRRTTIPSPDHTVRRMHLPQSGSFLVGRSSSQGMSLNRSQFGGCSTKYNTPAGNWVVYKRTGSPQTAQVYVAFATQFSGSMHIIANERSNNQVWWVHIKTDQQCPKDVIPVVKT